MRLQAILVEIKRMQGWNQAELARQLGVTQSTISRWITGKQKPEIDQRDRILGLAKKLGVVKSSDSGEDFTVAIVGYVGGGGQIIYSEGQGPFDRAPMPPGKSSPDTVAVIVRGDSMAPQFEDGWTVYYDNRQAKPSESLLHKPCVVGLRDGRVLIKKLLPGRRNGTYDLHSVNGAPLLDQQVEWAAKVTWIAPT